MKKHTSPTHPDYGDTLAALDMLQRVVDEMNTVIQAAENAEKLLKLQELLGGSTVPNLVIILIHERYY